MSTTTTTQRKFDVFLSFRGLETRRNLISFLYRELVRRKIQTFKDDKDLKSGRRISPELDIAIEESRFAVVVVSVKYTASRWCLEELVKIMDLEKEGKIEVIPIFYGVDPSKVRRQIGVVRGHFEKHKHREENPEKLLLWKQALTNLADISGYCSSNWKDDSEMIDVISEVISKKVMIAKPRRSDRKLEGIDGHMEDVYQLLDLNSNKSVKIFGIWARGNNCRSALTKFVYDDISQHFKSHFFLESVKRNSQEDSSHMSNLHEDFQRKIQGESLSKPMLKNQKVLLVADDVYKLEQLDALADDFNSFGPGSIVIISTQDKQLLHSYGITLVYEVDLKFQNVCLFRQSAFKRVGELCRQFSFRKRDADSAAFDSDVEIFCSLRDDFTMQNSWKPLSAQ